VPKQYCKAGLWLIMQVKKGATLNMAIMAITLSILDGFAQFFHCCKEHWISKKTCSGLLTIEQRISNVCTSTLHFWSDFQQDIIDTAVDQWRKRLQVCVRTNDGHFERLLWTNSYKQFAFFMCFCFKWLLALFQFFLLCWCLMVNKPAMLNCKALSKACLLTIDQYILLT